MPPANAQARGEAGDVEKGMALAREAIADDPNDFLSAAVGRYHAWLLG